MQLENDFSKLEPGTEMEFEEIRQLEPIFHAEWFGSSSEAFARRMSQDYWEVGASGRRYSRAFILEQAEKIASVNAKSAGWSSSQHALRRLGHDTFLFTYTLNQNGRVTRRATIWQRSAVGWQILYHQGTIVSVDEDDTLPG